MEGDPHNFGRRVTKTADGWFYKPRTVFWERLVLEATSPLRQAVDHLFASKSRVSPFASVPTLRFLDCSDEGPGAGRVEGLFVDPLSTNPAPGELEQAGALTGFLTWAGATDLHAQNMATGRWGGRFVFAPLDVEGLFHDHQLVSQTTLLPSQTTPPEDCGLAALLASEKSGDGSVALLSGYLSAFSLLSAAERDLGAQVIGHLPAEVPCRLLVRATAAYAEALRSGVPSDYAASEKEQLARGDVPYFFRRHHSEVPLYWKSQWETAPAVIPAIGPADRFELRRVVPGQGLAPSPARFGDTALKAGSLQLARAFDPGESGQWSSGGCTLRADKQTLTIEWRGESWQAKRQRAS